MPHAAIQGGLAEFQTLLIGCWANQELPNSDKGGQDQPLSYCVMPLPQTAPQNGENNGYILKNFTLYEFVQFNNFANVALPATAPNRGADVLQVPTAVFYEQQVHFAEGPGIGKIVHAENGAWLNLATDTVQNGPYPPNFPEPNPPNDDKSIAKQMSVPHGNSILALGTYDDPASGAPTIDSADVIPTPAGLNTQPYETLLNQPDNYQNPQPDLTANVNGVISTAIGIIDPTSFIHWAVDSTNNGFTVNIPFENRQAKVVKYVAEYWLLSEDGETYPWLAYSQNIVMEITIGGTAYRFPHWTTNVVTKVSESNCREST